MSDLENPAENENNEEVVEEPNQIGKVLEENKEQFWNHEENIIEEQKETQSKPIQEKDSENDELKEYQAILQGLKEEIASLNKKIDQKSKESNSEHTEEEIFKLQSMCKYSKQEIKELTQKLEEIQKTSEKTAENVEKLKNSSFDDNSSNEILENLTGKLAELEEEYAELTKSSNEINFPDLDKILAPDASLKLINEFYVNVQKRLGFLDLENGNLAATLKKYSSEALKLREKCEKAAHRYKSNDELKNKLRDLEESFAKYVLLEEKLALELKQAEEEYRLHSGSLENKLDLPAAQKMLEEIEILAKKDQEDVEKLEFQLQEKRNMLRAARAYGLQRSKTSNKLRSDMELLGLVLVEKDQNISKLKREINELKMKHAQAEAEIKEINDKKNHS